MNMDEIIRANTEAGQYFFAPSAMRAFGSRLSRAVYSGPGGVYFVTSENNHRGAARRYTVRRFDPQFRAVCTVGNYREHATARAAHAVARRAAADASRLAS